MLFITWLVLPVCCAGQTVAANTVDASDLTFKSGVSNVRIDVQVTGPNGELIVGLTKDDFTVFDEGKKVPLVYFGHDREPLSLMLLLDVSGSTRQYLQQIAAVAQDSLRYLMPKDRVAVMLFARNTRVSLPWTDDHAAVASALRQASNDASLGAGTNINDSLLEASKYIEETAGESGRRAVLILTDNLGLNYKSPDQPVIDSMFQSDSVVNAIVVGKGVKPEPVSGGQYSNPDFTSPDVFRISEETGGEAIKAEKAGQSFARMIERIRTRYSLHYNKPETATAGFRKVEVMLSPEARQRYPEAVLRYRRGYRVK